jgi:hypothetical protein
MEGWRKVWRQGIVPLVGEKGLRALQAALRDDDKRLVQGMTIDPQSEWVPSSWEPSGACLIAYCGWQGQNLDSIAKVQRFFDRIVDAASLKLLAWDVEVSDLVEWYDETDRPTMRRELLAEVDRALGQCVT